MTKTLLDPLADIVAASPVRAGLVNRPVLEVVPAEEILSPELEGRQDVHVRSVRQSQLILTELDPSLDRRRVIVKVRTPDQIVDPVHLHRDRLTDRDLSAHHGIPEHAVVLRYRRVRECHVFSFCRLAGILDLYAPVLILLCEHIGFL